MEMFTVEYDRGPEETYICWNCKGTIVDPLPCHNGCPTIEGIAYWADSEDPMRDAMINSMSSLLLYGVGLPTVKIHDLS
jgi:hypothetical protein